MRISRGVCGLITLALVITGVGAIWSFRATTAAAAATVETRWGPLSPADIDMVIKVRRAGLWENPVGNQMKERAVKARTREIGGFLANEHIQLDALVMDAADSLEIKLPNEPTEEQKGWIAEIDAADRPDFDRTAVMLLRAAHGNVLPLLTTIRTGTRNELVRKLAEDSAVFVQRHINYLESTKQVDFEALPAVPDPRPAKATLAGLPMPSLAAMLPALAILVVAGGFFVSARRTGRRRDEGAMLPQSRTPGSHGRHSGPPAPEPVAARERW